MKSHVNSLLYVSRGICKDIQAAYPEYRALSLDIKRLTLLSEERGLGLFTLDLPALDTVLTTGLETGLLPSHGYRKVSKEVKVPRLFSGLWLRIFTKDLCLRSNVDTTALFFLRSLLCVGKKTEVPCSQPRTRKAIEEYINVESALPEPTLKWGEDRLDPAGDGSRLHLCDRLGTNLPLFPDESGNRVREQALLNRCQQVADIVARELGNYCAYSFSEGRIHSGRAPGLKHGPGAVSERTGSFDKNDFQNWPNKLEVLFPWDLFGKMPGDPRSRPGTNEYPSRLICVPKTAKSPRIIAAEPTEHQWCQQLTKLWLEEAIRSSATLRVSIDFRKQSLSQGMVKSASKTRSHATVDLSSASDRLSCYVVERLFRMNPSLLAHLHASRTKWISLPQGSSSSHLVLKKFASQGTAVTFPVQTLCFYILAVGALHDDGNVSAASVKRLGKQVRVFGDDIILPTRGYERLVQILHRLDLRVNEEKSFSRGLFRESCGMDCYGGDDVTPVKPRTLVSNGPASWQSILDTSNNLFKKGLWNASESLRDRLDSDPRSRIAIVGPDAGISGHVSYSLPRWAERLFEESTECYSNEAFLSRIYIRELGRLHGRRIRSRFNAQLQRAEVSIDVSKVNRRVRQRACGYSSLLQFAISERGEASDSIARVTSEVLERSLTRKGQGWVDFRTLF